MANRATITVNVIECFKACKSYDFARSKRIPIHMNVCKERKEYNILIGTFGMLSSCTINIADHFQNRKQE